MGEVLWKISLQVYLNIYAVIMEVVRLKEVLTIW